MKENGASVLIKIEIMSECAKVVMNIFIVKKREMSRLYITYVYVYTHIIHNRVAVFQIRVQKRTTGSQLLF